MGACMLLKKYKITQRTKQMLEKNRQEPGITFKEQPPPPIFFTI